MTLKSGRDATVAGARVEGAVVTADIGGDLKIESRQDTYKMRSSQDGLSLSLGTGLGQAGWSGDVAGMAGQVWDKSAASWDNNAAGQQRTAGIGITYGRGSADKAWTENVTVIAGTKTADLKVAGNTHLKGAVAGVEGGEVRLDTGTFTYEDLRDYDRSKNLSLNVNLSYSWMGESEKGGALKAGQQAAAPAHADSWHKNIPVKVEGSYEEKNKEGVTRATVGAGTVAARDGAKQKQLEDGGKTGKLAAVNRDLSKTQEVTKDERKYVNFYASDTAVKTTVQVVEKAVEYIDKLVSNGLLSNDDAQKSRKLLDDVKSGKADYRTLADCSQGGKQTWLDNLFFTPAYAADGDACVIYAKGADGLYTDTGERISKEAHDAVRTGVIQANIDGMKEVIPQIISLENRSDLTQDEFLRLEGLKSRLQYHMNYFALCWDNSYSPKFNVTSLSDFFSQSNFTVDNRFYRNAQDFRKGGDDLAARYDSFSPAAAKAQELARKNPMLYAAIMNAESRKPGEHLLEAAYQLNGLVMSDASLTQAERQHTIQQVVNMISSSDLMRPGATPTVGWSGLVATQANAILYAIQDLPAGEKGYFVDLLKEQYALLTVKGHEYEYNKQLHRGEAELVRRTAPAYALAQGWCENLDQCSQGEALHLARKALMEQLIRQTDELLPGKFAEKGVFAQNDAAAAHLNALGQRIGMLVYAGDKYDLRGVLSGGKEYSERPLFWASDVEKKLLADKAWSFNENRDLYNEIKLPGHPYLHLSTYLYRQTFLNSTGLNLVGREQYLNTLVGLARESADLKNLFEDNWPRHKVATIEQFMQHDEYERQSSHLFYHIKNDLARAVLAGQLTLADLKAPSIFQNPSVAETEALHPGIAIAKFAAEANRFDWVVVSSIFAAARGKGGTQAAVPKGLEKLCFVAGTPVWTQEGIKPIEAVRAGDLVVSRDEQGGENVLMPVTHTIQRTAPRILHLTLERNDGEVETFGTTKDHPFHVPGRGFVAAGELQPGDLVTSGGRVAQSALFLAFSKDNDASGVLRVKSLSVEDKARTVYNFEVAGTHTYFVGQTRAWVHNNNLCTRNLVGRTASGDPIYAVGREGAKAELYVRQADGSFVGYARAGGATVRSGSLPQGYVRVSPTEIKGPQGGVYTATDRYDINGKPVYQNNGRYYVFEYGTKNPIPAGNLIDYSKISTAGSTQSSAPRNITEQIAWSKAAENPMSGRPLSGLNNDPRFQSSSGWQKMGYVYTQSDGQNITLHYQYNFNTGKVYDIKIVTPERVPVPSPFEGIDKTLGAK